MANMKTILLASGGIGVAFAAIIGMNMAASTKGSERFAGGVSAQKLPRQLPESNADPFAVIADEDEAARRATSNRTIADDELRKVEGVTAYTAPPVIHLEGSSGDAFDPMGAALVDQEEPPEPVEMEQIEPVKAPEREYKVPEVPEPVAVAPEPVPPSDPYQMEILRRALMGQRNFGVTIQQFKDDTKSVAPMTVQKFSAARDGARQGAGNAGLPMSALAEQAMASDTSTVPNEAPASAKPTSEIELPAQPVPAPATGDGVLRTIDPNSPASYLEGSLLNGDLSGNVFAAISTERDADYDWRQPVELAEVAIGIDNNARIYDTSRNAQAFNSGAIILPGDQRYATLMYGFNSDDATQLPVFAQLHDYGPASSAFLNGARLQGTLRLSTESAVMEFDKLILRDGRIVPISAMGISQDQLRVGVFKNVNRHTLSRYSSLLVSGLIKGIGDVGTQIIENKYSDNEGTTIIIGDGASTAEPDDGTLSDADRVAIAMGAVKPIGDELSAAAGEGFRRKPTVTAPAGFGFSIVFLDGLTFGQVQ
jgi:hypothetical protein